MISVTALLNQYIEPQILDILRTLSLGSKVLVLIKKKSVFQPGHVLNNVLKCSMYLKNAIIMTKCNIFSEIKDRKSQNFEKQKRRILQVGTNSKQKTLIKGQGEKKTFLPEKSNSTKLPPTQQKDKF